jgi:hypothetical protein
MLRKNGGQGIAFYRYDGGEYQYNSGVNPTLNTWQHLAVSRNGTSLKIFLEGTQIYSTTTSQSFNAVDSDDLFIGRMRTSVEDFNYFDGYIDDVVIYKGLALYTANFTPPTAAFVNP